MPRFPTTCLLVLALAAPFARADDDDSAPPLELEPVTVSAQKRDQAVTDVPAAVTAYTGTFLETNGVTRYEDLAPWVPGLFVSVQSPNTPSINLRGVSTDTNDPRAPMRLSIFVDGVPADQASGSVVELFDLERVEVLKGPQSTLFGRSAESGAIALITRRPDDSRSAELTVGAGDHGARQAGGYVNTPISGDRLLGRLAFTAVRHDGVVGNVVDGSDLSGRETVAVRPSLRWRTADDATTVDLILNWQHDTPPGTAFKSGVIPPPSGDTSPYTPAALTRGAALGINRTVWGATLRADHTLAPGWSLHAITGWHAYDSIEQFDGDGSIYPLLESTDRSKGHEFNQELRLNFDGGGKFSAFAGANYAHGRGEQRNGLLTSERAAWPFLAGSFRSGLIAAGVPAALANAAVPAMNPFVPQDRLPAGFAAFAAVPSLSSLAALAGAPLYDTYRESYLQDATLDAFDVFVDGTWRVTDRLELTAGARVSFENQTTGYQVDPANPPSHLGFIFRASPNFASRPTAGHLTDSDATTGWAGRAVARYAITPDMNAYASLARGRRPEVLVISSFDRYRTSEESIVNAEAGLKGRALQHRLVYSAALFEYRYRHFHTVVQDPANPTRFTAVDAGRATGRGGELSLQGVVSPDLQLTATYGYTDATFDATGDNGQMQQYAGSMLRLTSRHTAALGAIVTHDFGRRGRVEFVPVWQYRSRFYFDDDNTRLGGSLHQGGFAQTNVRLSWTSADRHWTATVHADNLFDKEYLVDAGNIGAEFGIPTFVRGEPRLIGVEVTRRF